MGGFFSSQPHDPEMVKLATQYKVSLIIVNITLIATIIMQTMSTLTSKGALAGRPALDGAFSRHRLGGGGLRHQVDDVDGNDGNDDGNVAELEDGGKDDEGDADGRNVAEADGNESADGNDTADGREHPGLAKLDDLCY